MWLQQRLDSFHIFIIAILVGLCALTAYCKADGDFLTPFESPDVQYKHLCRDGFNLLGADRFADALKKFDKAIELDNAQGAAFGGRGVAQFVLGKTRESVRDYDRAIYFQPHWVESLNNRGLAKATLGKYTDALADYDRVLQLDPGNSAALNNRAVVRERLGQHDAAIRDYTKAISLKPDWAILFWNRGLAFAELGNQFAAGQDGNRSIQLQPSIDCGGFCSVLKSLAELNQQIRMQPSNAELYYRRATARHELRDYVGSLSDNSIAISIDPGYRNAIADRAFDRATLKDLPGAIDDMSTFMQLAPASRAAHGSRGFFKLAVGDYRGALSDLDEAIRRLPDAQYYRLRAKAHSSLGDMPGAISDYLKSALMKPSEICSDLRITAFSQKTYHFDIRFRHDRRQVIELPQSGVREALQVTRTNEEPHRAEFRSES
jgi:tetratricopeptide (TPR) repeat protein